MDKDNSIVDWLEEYFKNTPDDKIIEDWNKSKEYDNIGPTVENFLTNNKKYNMKRQELVIANLAKEDNKLTIERAIAREKKAFEKTLNIRKEALDDLNEELADRLNSNTTLEYAIIENTLLNINKLQVSIGLMTKFITDYYGH